MNSFIQRAKSGAIKSGPMISVVILLTACGRQDAKVYEVPKEQPPAMAQGAIPPGHPDMSMGAMPGMAAASLPAKLTYTKPEGWNETAPGQMRVASFNVKNDAGKQADVSVIPLPGMAGGDEPNVNRWRGQVGLGTLSAEELAKVAEAVEVAGESAKLYDQAGTGSGSGEPTRILGVIQHRGDMAWFFKMTGDDTLVAKEKPAFVTFLKSVKFETAATPAELPAGHPPVDNAALPSGHPEISSAAAAATASGASSEGKPQWTVPAGWKEISGGQFLVAKFIVGGEGPAQTAVNVSSSAGDGGGLPANVNRWRKQLGLSELSADDLAKAAKVVDTAGGKATMIEMSGTDGRTGQPAALVGAMVVREGQAWFYKLMGDAKIVEGQKAAFTQFVKEVKY